jgi:hypothetical protein
MLLSQLELDLQPSLVRHSHDVFGLYAKIREPLPALDPTHTNVGTQLKIGWKFALCYRYFERPSAGNDLYTILVRGGDLSARGSFVCDQPAGHRDLEGRH